MTLSKKPPKKTSSLNEDKIQNLIKKGGSTTPENNHSDDDKISYVSLRLPKKVVRSIDGVRKDKTIVVSRHQWIFEAILERLKQEERA